MAHRNINVLPASHFTGDTFDSSELGQLSRLLGVFPYAMYSLSEHLGFGNRLNNRVYPLKGWIE